MNESMLSLTAAEKTHNKVWAQQFLNVAIDRNLPLLVSLRQLAAPSVSFRGLPITSDMYSTPA
jgi:hypothetical protein